MYLSEHFESKESRRDAKNCLHWLTDSSWPCTRVLLEERGASHPGYLGMLGGSGGCVAARNRGGRPRKIAASRAANSARPPPSREPSVILERFVFVPEYRGGRHATRTRDRVLPRSCCRFLARPQIARRLRSACPVWPRAQSVEIDARATPTRRNSLLGSCSWIECVCMCVSPNVCGAGRLWFSSSVVMRSRTFPIGLNLCGVK